MTDSTILVVDADQETEEKIVSILEAEGNLVFTASGRDVSAGMVEKIKPSLIYLKPASNSIEGFETCKKIHKMEKISDVPIILLASLKGPLDPRYTTFYGIVDYLKMPVSSEELIEKTNKILGSGSPDLQEPAEEDIGFMEEESVVPEELPEMQEMYAGDTEINKISEIGQPGEDFSYSEVREKLYEGLGAKGMRRRPGQYDVLIPVGVVTAAIVIVAGGFLLYKFYISPAEKKATVAVKPPQQVQQQNTAVLPPREPQEQERPVAEAKPVETKEAPQKTPAAVPAAKPVGKPVYSVQLGAFKSEGSAEALAKTYKDKDYEAFTHKGKTKDKDIVYRVLIGKFDNRREAFQLAGKIETKEKIKVIVFSGE